MYRDLTHPIRTGIQIYPGDPEVSVSPAATVSEDGVAVQEICCGSHTGTHIDAPSHTEPDGTDLDDRPIGEYVFDARFVDIAPCSRRERIEPDAVVPALADDDESPDLLVVRTGFDEHWNTDRYLEHPYLAPETAVALRELGCGVALDTLNPDPTPTANAADDEPDGFPAHRALLGAELPIIENLTSLAGLPDRFRLYAFPLAVQNADGSPIRAVAAVE
ncbi:cyclase family protein [Natrarchaeobius halalkaliphilus]|uniref:Cyclase family protein n=1 Tax=Natrarchaeobius halalkaliphilus TaxID=1679091 RepID=A0A3N6LYN8_9EURY|nr:cyclase family protein [Natrarchaeobius halalkaliphilus]RQG92984.1 cyclase family protein [Natrarchaeobius halalkaliphilus]